MAMSKKYYEMIAAVLLEARVPKTYSDAVEWEACCDWVASELAGRFRQDNQLFDRSRFLLACGVKLKVENAKE